MAPALYRLVHELDRVRGRLPREEWLALCRECREHPVAPLLYQNPQLERSFVKPRGYAGDAVTLDYYYRYWDGLLDGVSRLGLELLRHSVAHPVQQAVRARCKLIASTIDDSAFRVERARVLSIGCGHARELDQCVSVRGRVVGEFVGVDQDPLSVQCVQETFRGLPVTALCEKIRDLILGRLPLGQFDLIYSLGVLDYLDHAQVAQLLRATYRMLAPGGRLLLGNFMPGMQGIAYAECFANWQLELRSTRELAAIAQPLGAPTRTFSDALGCIAYLELVRP
jgi:SAM-dependent methyltransferase